MYVHPVETYAAKYFKLLRIARAYIEAVTAIKEKYAFYEWC